MLRAAVVRLPFLLALVLVSFFGTYLLTGLAPGDAADGAMMRGMDAHGAERARLGLDVPLGSRVLTRAAALWRLDLGTSHRFGRPVLPLVVERAANTALAGGSALLLALAVGLPAGVVSARARHPLARALWAAMSLLLLSVPALVLALLLAVAFSAVRVPMLVVVVLSLALPAAAIIERLQSRAFETASGALCLTAARARGVPDARVAWRHAWPLSLPAVIGTTALLAGQVLSGSLAVELVTGWPGLGRLMLDALLARDLDLAAGCAGAAAVLVGTAAWTADVVHVLVDPRVTR
jgi:ABC-type dipeptide/oligopeptide/nickel transport system permease component